MRFAKAGPLSHEESSSKRREKMVSYNLEPLAIIRPREGTWAAGGQRRNVTADLALMGGAAVATRPVSTQTRHGAPEAGLR